MRERTIGLKHNWTIYALRTGNYYAIWGKKRVVYKCAGSYN